MGLGVMGVAAGSSYGLMTKFIMHLVIRWASKTPKGCARMHWAMPLKMTTA